MSQPSYKELHERFMQNHSGTTPLETVLIIAPTAFTIILANCFSIIASKFFKSKIFLIEFFILVIPLVLHSTLFSEYIAISLIIMILLSILFIIMFKLSTPKQKINWIKISKTLDINLLTTHFRGTINLITAICILAVDFQSFPRRFAKTETRGWGLMDTGVGLFVVANGLVDPVARGLKVSLKKVSKGCVPLFILGVLRYVSVSSIEYQQHVTEYGTHWNFFFTLALTKLIGTAMLELCDRPLSWTVLCVKAHYGLLVNGVAQWVLGDTPRDNFLNANREGICSLLGYIAIYQCSVSLGCWLRSQQDTLRAVPKLATVSAIMWTIAILSGPPSRRLADLGFISWMIGYGSTLLCLLLAAQVISIYLGIISHSNSYSPLILAEINSNSLAFFMLANLLTGVINMSVNTLYVAPIGSLVIVTMYMFLLCFTIHKLYSSRTVLKCW